MEQQLAIETTPATIHVNFEDVAAALDQELAHYNALVVTPDNLKDAKKSATELNKFAGEIDQRRKDAVSQVSEPIKLFETQMKALRRKCQDSRQGILDQVDKFENQVREQAECLLREKRAALWEEYDVDGEFQRAEFDDLIRLGSVTDKGNLAKSPRETLEYRVRDDRAMQDRTERRLLELEAESYKAGLDAPLTRAHVAHFLHADNYQAQLTALINVEVRRQAEAQARREQTEAKREPAPQEAATPAPAAPPVEPIPPVAMPDAPAGREVWRVTVVFPISCKAGVAADAIESKVQERLGAAGIADPSYIKAVCEVSDA